MWTANLFDFCVDRIVYEGCSLATYLLKLASVLVSGRSKLVPTQDVEVDVIKTLSVRKIIICIMIRVIQWRMHVSSLLQFIKKTSLLVSVLYANTIVSSQSFTCVLPRPLEFRIFSCLLQAQLIVMFKPFNGI